VEFGVLGPLLITRDGHTVEIGAPKQRVLLIHLLLRVGETVPLDRLIDGLWGQDPPPQARATLRSYVSHLRRTLEGADGRELIVTRGSGYGLQVDPESVDAVRFERLVVAARKDLAAEAAQAALIGLEEALGLWRGAALADVADSDLARGERTRLEELRLSAQEDRFDALLALGRHREAVAALEAFTAAEPFRERPHAQLMLGLYRSGRAPDALDVFQRFRETLLEELGLDPSPQLANLVERILKQATDLDLPPVTQAVSAPAVAGAPVSRLVGRAHELAELDALVGRLLAGEGGLLLVAGEPGIGKTALLGELGRLAAAAGAGVVWGRCHETSGAPAFWPWVQVLREVAGWCSDEELQRLVAGTAAPVTQLVNDIAERLGKQQALLGEELESARFQLYDAIETFLRRASEPRPLVVLLDDLHWADTPTLQALAFLTPLLGPTRLLVAGSYRDVRADWAEELEATLAAVVREPATEQLGLAGLQPAAVAELAAGLGGEPLSAAEIELLHERTRGNPFFVRQLSRLLSEAGGDGGQQIPTGVRHVIARRLSLLPGDVRGLLEVAAVIGAQFSLRALAAATQRDSSAMLDAVGHAAGHGLLEPVGRPVTGYRFVHALVRETIYDSLAPHAAARLHAQVAAALEATPHTTPAELAEHFWQAAELFDDDRPVVHLMNAADEAMAVLAYEQAETSLRRALAVLADRGGDPAVELQVRMRLVRLLAGIHGWGAEAVEEVAAPAVTLARRAGFSPDVASLWMAVVLGCIARGDIRTADGLVDELLAGAQAGTPPHPAALAAAHAAVAYMAILLGRDPAAALEHAYEAQRQAALTPAEHLEGATHHLQVTAINMEVGALAFLGEAAGAVAAGRRAIALATEVAGPLPQAVAWMTAAYAGTLVDDAAFAAEASAGGLAVCERHGLSFTGHLLTTLHGWACARLGQDPAAQLARMSEALEALGRFGHANRANPLLFTAETALLAGDVVAARRWLDEARALSARTGEYLQPERLRRVEEALTGPVPA
jgi:DNA-binding SARP family transcriptional activator